MAKLNYLLRDIPPSLWKRVQGRLRRESQDAGRMVTIRQLVLRQLRKFAR